MNKIIKRKNNNKRRRISILFIRFTSKDKLGFKIDKRKRTLDPKMQKETNLVEIIESEGNFFENKGVCGIT